MVFEKVRKILAELLSIDENTITMDSLIIDNLGADSLDLVDAVVTLNDEFGVEVPDEEIGYDKNALYIPPEVKSYIKKERFVENEYSIAGQSARDDGLA